MSIYEKEQPKSDSIFLKLEDGESAKVRMIGGGIDYMKAFREGEEPKIRFASVVIYRNPETKANEAKVFNFGWQIQKQLKALLNDEDWGDLEGYDVTVTRTGKELETKYTIMPSPKSIRPLSDEERDLVADANINLRVACKVEDAPDDEWVPPEDE